MLPFYDRINLHVSKLLRGPRALLILFFGSLIESTVFAWPIEFPLLAYMLRGRRYILPVTLLVTLGSILGALLSFTAGVWALSFLEPWIAARPELADRIDQARDNISLWGARAVAIAMLTPVPVQITSFAAGLANLPVTTFFLAVLVGRSLRYSSMAIIVFIFYDRIESLWTHFPTRLRFTIQAAIYIIFAALFIFSIFALF